MPTTMTTETTVQTTHYQAAAEPSPLSGLPFILIMIGITVMSWSLS